MSNRPAATEYPSYSQKYVDLVPEEDIVAALEKQGRDTVALLRSLTEEKAKSRYAPGKWSVKEVVRHFTDGERVFDYRALAFARGEKASLPGFDENEYAAASDADSRSLRDLIDEYDAVRRSTVALYRGMSREAWTRSGTANNNPATVRGLAYVTLGHERHHLKVLREKYGVG
jgi:hypothetical protein